MQMPRHTAHLTTAPTAWRVYLDDRLLLETSAVIELTEQYGERTFPTVPYFAPAAVAALAPLPSGSTTTCPLKGTAQTLTLAGVPHGAWRYANPNTPVAAIAGHVGFDPNHGFRVERVA
jgi:uncharacterized protein (DUF427 family)